MKQQRGKRSDRDRDGFETMNRSVLQKLCANETTVTDDRHGPRIAKFDRDFELLDPVRKIARKAIWINGLGASRQCFG